MEEKRINKTSQIEVRIYPETKKAFLSKMSDLNIQDCCSFMVWCLDKWILTESNGMKSVTYPVRTLIGLMPIQVVPRGFKFGDTLFFRKFRDGDRRFLWYHDIQKACRESRYKRPTNVMRCLIYAIVLAQGRLILDLYNEYILDNVRKIHFRHPTFRVKIKSGIYEKLERLYGRSPATATRCVLDVLLGDESVLKESLSRNLKYKLGVYTDRYEGDTVELKITNDLYRLRIYEFMVSHGIKSRSELMQSLLNAALRLPDLVDPDMLIDKYGFDDDESDYETDMYDRMSRKNYKYTGS